MENTALEEKFKKFAREIRGKTLECIASIGIGHVGGSLSIADLMAVLYGEVLHIRPGEPRWPQRDKVVISKGHAGPCVYATLALKGFFPMEQLYTLNQNGTSLPSHTDRQKTTGVDMSTGSLGQGASTAAGLALCDKLNRAPSKTYLILGDGECNEGQVWEAMLFASHHKLDNLIVIVDYNRLQVDGTTSEVCDLGDLVEKFKAFGCYGIDVPEGNDVMSIYAALKQAQKNRGRPSAVILHTVKGAGVKRFEGRAACHHCALCRETLRECLEELGVQPGRESV